MDTLQEALFKAMLNHDWFTDSDGDVESPDGYFGYVVNEPGCWDGVEDAFSDTIRGYSEISPDLMGNWIDNNFYGVWFASINSDGIIRISRMGDYVRTPGVPCLGIEVTPVVAEAQKWFRDATESYNDWADQIGAE